MARKFVSRLVNFLEHTSHHPGLANWHAESSQVLVLAILVTADHSLISRTNVRSTFSPMASGGLLNSIINVKKKVRDLDTPCPQIKCKMCQQWPVAFRLHPENGTVIVWKVFWLPGT